MVLMRLLCLSCLLHDLSQDGVFLIHFVRSRIVWVVAPVFSRGSGSFTARDVPAIFPSEPVGWHGSYAGRQTLVWPDSMLLRLA